MNIPKGYTVEKQRSRSGVDILTVLRPDGSIVTVTGVPERAEEKARLDYEREGER